MIRHVLAPKPVPTRALGVQNTAAEGLLISPLRVACRTAASQQRATFKTIALATIARATDVNLHAASSAEKTTHGFQRQNRPTNNR
jgi:hypothetical protein